MKSIALIANTGQRKQHVTEYILDNLHEVLGHAAAIQTYYINDFTAQTRIDHDVILVLDYNRLPEIQEHVSHQENIIFAERTFLRENLTSLYQIPSGSSVLVVNDAWSSTLETVEHLYQATGGYLQFVPYQPSHAYPDIHTAITPGEAECVPGSITDVYDIGNRCLNVYTFWQILNRLHLDDKQAKERLLSYAEKTVEITSSVNKQYRELFIKSEIIENVTKQLNEGIVITDAQYRVAYFNEKVPALLPSIAQGEELQRLLADAGVHLTVDRALNSELVDFNGTATLVSKREISHVHGQPYYYFDLQDDIYIKNLGHSLNQELQKGLVARHQFSDIFCRSESMKAVIRYGEKVAQSDFSVLVTGETGTGKELMAQALHNASNRKFGPFVAVNCAALPESLLESELFGYEKGAFTGANAKGKIGLFEQADGGTIFLDEIGDMPLLLQTRLLRVLQEHQIMRLGGDRFIPIDIRVIAATNQDLNRLTKENKFRLDLLYRINTFQLQLPPLRQRHDDILPLLSKFTGGESDQLPQESLDRLTGYAYPGNIRELQNISRYICLMKSIPDYLAAQSHPAVPLQYLSVREAIALLHEVHVCTENGETIGREKLCARMQGAGFRIGEYRIKNGLDELQKLGLLQVKRGRSGTTLTPAGQQYLGENAQLL